MWSPPDETIASPVKNKVSTSYMFVLCSLRIVKLYYYIIFMHVFLISGHCELQYGVHKLCHMDLPMTVEFSTAAASVARLREMKCPAFSWGIAAMSAISI